MTGRGGALKHINISPETEEVVWSCRERSPWGSLAAGNRPMDAQATHKNKTETAKGEVYRIVGYCTRVGENFCGKHFSYISAMLKTRELDCGYRGVWRP